MAIGFRAAGTVAETTTATLTVGAPAGVAATDFSLMTISIKPYNITVSGTPAGWIKVLETTNGVVASGADVGSTRVVIYRRIGTYSNTIVTLSAVPTIAQGVTTAYTRGGSEAWLVPLYSSGIDDTNGANFSATAAAVLGTTTNNWLIGCASINSDLGTPSAIALAAPGATLGATTARVNTATGTGDDMRLIVADAACTSGTGSSPPTFTYTNASSTSGSVAFIRLTTVAASINVATIDPFDDKAGYTVSLTGLNFYDQWQTTRVSSFNDLYLEEFVRGGELQNTTTSAAALSDYEFHFSDLDSVTEESLTYSLKLYESGVLQDILTSSAQNPVLHRSQAAGFSSFQSPVTFIKDVATPLNSISAIIENFNAYQKSGRVLAEHQVLGKRNPIVISDVASGMRGSFTLIVVGVSGGFSAGGGDTIYNTQIEALFSSGSTYYFQSIFPYVVGIGDFYFQLSDYSFSRSNRIPRQNVARASDLPANIHPLSVWEVSFIEVDRPSDLDIASVTTTWGSGNIVGGTWQNVNDTNSNWFDVLDVN